MWGRGGVVNLLDTAEMAAFFEQLDHLTEDQLLSMRAAWRSTSRESHEEAWTAVRSIGVREGLTREIDRVRNRALRWVSRGSNSIPYRISSDVTWLQIKIEAGEANVADVRLHRKGIGSPAGSRYWMPQTGPGGGPLASG